MNITAIGFDLPWLAFPKGGGNSPLSCQPRAPSLKGGENLQSRELAYKLDLIVFGLLKALLL